MEKAPKRSAAARLAAATILHTGAHTPPDACARFQTRSGAAVEAAVERHVAAGARNDKKQVQKQTQKHTHPHKADKSKTAPVQDSQQEAVRPLRRLTRGSFQRQRRSPRALASPRGSLHESLPRGDLWRRERPQSRWWSTPAVPSRAPGAPSQRSPALQTRARSSRAVSRGARDPPLIEKRSESRLGCVPCEENWAWEHI